MARRKAAGPASTKSTTTKPAVNGAAKPKATQRAPAKAPAKPTTKPAAKAPAKRAAPKAAAKAPPKPNPKPATKAAMKAPADTTTTKNAANTSRKRKATDDEQEDEPKINGVKRARTTSKSATPAPATKPKATAKKAPATKKPKEKTVLTKAPTSRLDIYTFGDGGEGELGQGNLNKSVEIKRPRLNALLAADKVGVVAMSVGGMHVAVLTHDNKILTWGVNDLGALGRDTKWEAPVRDISDGKSDSASDDDETDPNAPKEGLNPLEAAPGEVDVSALPEGIVWTQLTCTDSATFALTDDGLVYGWGTFRGDDGAFGFKALPDGSLPKTDEEKIQRTPVLVERLKDITQLAAGDNHVLALSKKGEVFAWGAGKQNQLGRRILERHPVNTLLPDSFGLKKDFVVIGAGAFHSFAVQKSGKVYAWGLNAKGQTGFVNDIGTAHNAVVIKSLQKFGKVVCITGGAHHTVAVTDKGELLVWGQLNGCQLGLDISTLAEDDIIRDSLNKPGLLKVPTQIPGIEAVQAAAGSDHCIAVTRDGKAYSWGFSINYQTGQGPHELDEKKQPKDVAIATHIDNTAVRGKKLVQAGCGGQFSALAGLAGVSTINGA